MISQTHIWVLIPAAGSGARMQAALPKQYLPLRGRPVLLHTVERLCAYPRIDGVMVGIGARDDHWPSIKDRCGAFTKFIGSFTGGDERANTVLKGIDALSTKARDTDWVMVHDGVRPCVRHADIGRLIDTVAGGIAGGLLAVAVNDTIKRADSNGDVIETVPRAGLWRALTPQMFRLGELRRALQQALERGEEITDEAAAMERVGVRPRVVLGQTDNIKITFPADLGLAELILAHQERER